MSISLGQTFQTANSNSLSLNAPINTYSGAALLPTFAGVQTLATDEKHSILDPNDKWTQLVQKQLLLQAKEKNASVASSKEWDAAWKQTSAKLAASNVAKVPIETMQYLYEQIGALPPGHPERISKEAMVLTLGNVIDPKGCFLDNITEESYKDLMRLSNKCPEISLMIGQTKLPKVNSSGQLDGEPVQLSIANAGNSLSPSNIFVPNTAQRIAASGQPMGNSVGQHADTDHSIIKNSAGPERALPASVTAQLDKISPRLSNETSGGFVQTSINKIRDIPSNICGSLRHLMAALDNFLSVPFGILSDAYNGLMNFVDQIAKLVELAVKAILKWIVGIVGALLDSIIPLDYLIEFCAAFTELMNGLGPLGDLLCGFSAIGGIAANISAIGSLAGTGAEFGTKLQVIFTSVANIIDIVQNARPRDPGCAGVFKARTSKFAARLRKWGKIAGMCTSKGIDNLNLGIADAIKSLIPAGIGKLIEDLRHVTSMDIVLSLLPSSVANSIKRIFELCCGAGYHGNPGYSVGNNFESYREMAYENALKTWPTFAAWVSKLFNKKAINFYSYQSYSNDNASTRSEYTDEGLIHKGTLVPGSKNTSGQLSSFKPIANIVPPTTNLTIGSQTYNLTPGAMAMRNSIINNPPPATQSEQAYWQQKNYGADAALNSNVVYGVPIR